MRGHESKTTTEALFDEYLEHLLEGNSTSPAEFLESHDCQDPTLRRKLDGIVSQLSRWESERKAHAVHPDLLLGERLGDYQILRKLGRGGMGVVYLAQQETLGRNVALKVIRPDYSASEVALQRFEREAHSAASLRHPNIVTVFAVGEDRGVRYLAMELVPGRGLDELLTIARLRGELLDLHQVLRWGVGLANALDYAHQHGVVHRDVKPSNIRITPEGEALLLDFGLAHEVQDAASLTEDFVGTPYYAAPEQLDPRISKIDGRADVYGLGATLYQCLTGRAPFEGASVHQVLAQIAYSVPRPIRELNSHLSRDIHCVVSKALEKRPALRYTSAASFEQDLQAILDVRPISARHAFVAMRWLQWVRRRPSLAGTAGLAMLSTLTLIAILFVWRASESEGRLRAAEEAVRLAEQLVEDYQPRSHEVSRLEAEIHRLRLARASSFMSVADDRRLNDGEDAIAVVRRDRDEEFYRILHQIREAERLDVASSRLDPLYARIYRERSDEARASGEAADSKLYLDLARQYQSEKPIHDRGPVSLSVHASVVGAELHLFRLVSLRSLYPGGDRRLVPVPLRAASLPWNPAHWALRVTRGVPPLSEGDVILEIRGEPIRGTLFVREGSGILAAGDLLVAVDGERPADLFLDGLDPALAREEPGVPHIYEFERAGETIEIEAPSIAALQIELATARELAEIGGDRALVWIGGRREEIVLPPGLEVRTTAKPCFLGPDSLLAESVFPLAEGESCIFVTRAPGYALHISIVDPTGWQEPSMVFAPNLIRREAVPVGFIPVQVGHRTQYIQEREVTLAEYLEFVNDPGTIAFIAASSRPTRVPRKGSLFLCPPGTEGGFELPEGATADWPVLGIDWEDARAYARWRTERAVQNGEPWRYSLPLFRELGNAGRGRPYTPFRPKWISSCFSRPKPEPRPTIMFPTDESYFGIYDLTGSTSEWLIDDYGQGRARRHIFGGNWAISGPENVFESGSGADPNQTSRENGFRLVATKVE